MCLLGFSTTPPLPARTTRVSFFYLFFVLFGGRSQLAVELDHLCGGGELLLRTRGVIVSPNMSMVSKTAARQLHSAPVAVSESGHTGN